MISFEKLFDGVKIQEIQNPTIDKFFNHPTFDSNKVEKDEKGFFIENNENSCVGNRTWICNKML